MHFYWHTLYVGIINWRFHKTNTKTKSRIKNNLIDWGNAKTKEKACTCDTNIRTRESMWIRNTEAQVMNRDEGGTFWRHVFDLLLRVRHEPERKRSDQLYSEDVYRIGYPKLSIREWIFGFVLTNLTIMSYISYPI